jgi:hypothetical protein
MPPVGSDHGLAPPAQMARNQAVPVSLAYKMNDSSRASEPINKALYWFNMAERSESQISMNLAELFPPAHAAEVIEFDSIHIIQVQFTTLLGHKSVPSYTDNVRPNALDTDEFLARGRPPMCEASPAPTPIDELPVRPTGVDH